jgi:WD40 repeat protein
MVRPNIDILSSSYTKSQINKIRAAVAVSGDVIVSAGSDHTANFWSVSDGKLRKSFKALYSVRLILSRNGCGGVRLC